MQKDMQALAIRLHRLDVRFSHSSPFFYDCEFSRAGSHNTIDFTGPDFSRVAYARASTFLFWLWHCPPEVTSITVNLSDGDHPSDARFAASVRNPRFVALPDPYFFLFRGFEHYRQQSEQDPMPWLVRSDRLRWRGTCNGHGHIDWFSPEAAWNPAVLPRLRMALILKDQPGCDVVFSSPNRSPDHREALQAHGLLGNPIPESDWIDDKFALDIDGHTNTWSNFLVRLHLGCCVIKVDSQEGYRQWYYDRIRPWEHFVPVKADMSDLIEKIEWARSHEVEARQIAANGQVFARSMTFESETDWAVNTICAVKGVRRI